ncbi:long-chain acyl-CoA synthetase [Oxalobacteraceae bacterium GrIS 2.11]
MSNSTPTSPNPELTQLKTLPELFTWRVTQTPNAEAYRQFDEASGTWLASTWQETSQCVDRFINALAQLNLQRGARIAILLPNGLDAVCIDQATLAMGYVPVPMHALDNPASIAYILQDSDASMLIADSDVQWKGIAEAGLALPAMQQVVVSHQTLLDYASPKPLVQLTAWLAQATKVNRAPQAPDETDLAALVYTSGTTGKPKGVMLTHLNVMSNVLTVVQRVAPVPGDVFLSFLPLSHTFERTAGYYLAIASGSCVAYSRSAKQLPQDLLEVRPTILISVPRVYERVYSVIQTRLAGSTIQSMLFEAAIAVGWRRFNREQGRLNGDALTALLDALAWSVLEPLIAQKLIDQFGGRLRIAVSGGAALSQAISRCFLGLGIPIVQGYGMTETSPVVAFNAPDDNDPSTVGRVMSNVEVRIGENAELQVRGPNVMRGYWKRDEDTVKAFVDGWLRTGDQAELVDGRVRIKGRLKEIIVTSTGEKIAPVDLELAILNDAVFEQAYVFGENKPFIGCALVLSKKYWNELATSLGLNPDDQASLSAREAREVVLPKVRELTKSFPYYAQPKAVILSIEPWTVENTLITPTLKLKRNNLAAHFEQGIQSMYSQPPGSKK